MKNLTEEQQKIIFSAFSILQNTMQYFVELNIENCRNEPNDILQSIDICTSLIESEFINKI